MAVLLIICEGKTEQAYFDMLANRIYRIPTYHKIVVAGEKGQHKPLVDQARQAAAEIMEEPGLGEDEVETWAVCDDDKMSYPFSELKNYADARNIRLAFSRPQFEAFLLQHFEQSRDYKPKEILDKLSAYRQEYEGDKSVRFSKTELGWLERAIYDKPKLIETAVINARQRETPSHDLFLTVHHLVERLSDLERR